MRSLAGIEDPRINDVRITTEVSGEWMDIFTHFNNISDSDTAIAKQLLSSKSYLKKGFFALYLNSLPVAVGVGVVERNYVGLYDIVTASNYRNQGYGKQFILQRF